MKVFWAGIALLLVAGCGGNAARGSGPAAKPAAPQLDSATAIGKRIGCQSPLRLKDSIAQEERVCKINGGPVSIIRTPDLQTAKAYVKMGSGFGANYMLVNDHWLVAAHSRTLIQHLAAKNDWKMF